MPTARELISRAKLADLSSATGIAEDRLSRLSQFADPSMAELRKLAGYFRLDVRDLLPPGPRAKTADLLFRQMGAGADENTFSTISRRIGYSMDLVAANQAAGPWWSSHFTRGKGDYAEAETNASIFRTLFFGGDELGPVLSLPKIVAGAMGVLLFVIRNSKIDGASAFIEGLPFAFVSDRFAPRMLFTLAHELGHLLAHHDPSSSFAVVDAEGEHFGSKERKNKDEFYAHAFASCLLMPARGVAVALHKIRSMQSEVQDEVGDLEILLLAQIYGVSFYVAARRCEDLELLPKGGAASLADVIAKKYGSPEKRAQQANLPPRPVLEFPRVPEPLLSAALSKIRSGDLSIGRASAVLGLSISDLVSANAPSTH
jgi:Zn-dependent peptidase ImmA (M78 family)